MKKYTIFCTAEQTKKALELGAPINTRWDYDGNQLPFEEEISIEYRYYAEVPTAEQMISWVEEKSNISTQVFPIEVDGNRMFVYVIGIVGHKYEPPHHTRKEATLAAIDALLEYLANNTLITT